MTGARPVWLTEDEFQALSYAVDVCGHEEVERIGDVILDRYRRAPADPAEAVLDALADFFVAHSRVQLEQVAPALLIAIGFPWRALGASLPDPEDTP